MRLRSHLNFYAARGRDNNFQLIRLFAAAAVVYAHSYFFVSGNKISGKSPYDGDVWYELTGMHSGMLGVQVFFILSGYLVSQSLWHRESIRLFLRARALRIFPGLVVCVSFIVFLLGPILTSLSIGEYFSNTQTYHYLLVSSSLTNIRLPTGLPGVFSNNPIPNMANGSLWTLPWELLMYGSLTLTFLIKKFRAPLFDIMLFGVIGFFMVQQLWHPAHRFELVMAAWFGGHFYIGAAFFRCRKIVPCNWHILAAALLCFSIMALYVKNNQILWIPMSFLLGYLTLLFAYLPDHGVRYFNRMGDYSYGVYIYACPIQQTLVMLQRDISATTLLLQTLPLVLLMASMSWHLIEKPALRRIQVPESDHRITDRVFFTNGKRVSTMGQMP